MRFSNRSKLICLLVGLVFLFSCCPVVSADSTFPAFAIYSGTVYYNDGNPVTAGTVNLYIDGVLTGSQAFSSPTGNYNSGTQTTTQGDYGKPVIFKVTVNGVEYPALTLNGIDASTNPITFQDDQTVNIVIAAAEEPPLQVAGTATDADVDMADDTTVSANNTWELNISSGTVKSGVSESDLTITGLPGGLSATAAKGTGNNIVVTVAGTASSPVTATVSVSIVVRGTAVEEDDATDSSAIGVTVNPAEVVPFQIMGTATDSVVTMASGNTTVSADNTWVLNITNATPKSGVSESDLEITGIPDGLSVTAAKGTGNTIVVTVAGTASSPVSAATSVSLVVKESAVTEPEATDSDAVEVTINPAEPPASVLEVSVQAEPTTIYKGQSVTINASATKDSEPVSVTWQVSIEGANLDAVPPSGATYTATWSPGTFSLPVEKQYTLEVKATSTTDGTVTKTSEITFINYSIYVTGVEKSGSTVTASLKNLGSAVSGECVFQFFDGSIPVGCQVVSGAIPTGSSVITSGIIPDGADSVKVSVVKLYSSGSTPDWDNWNSLSGPGLFSLGS